MSPSTDERSGTSVMSVLKEKWEQLVYFYVFCLFASLFKLSVYLFERQSLNSLVHFPSACNSRDWVDVESRSQESDFSFPYGWQGPHYLSHHLLPPGACVSR